MNHATNSFKELYITNSIFEIYNLCIQSDILYKYLHELITSKLNLRM